MRLYQCLVFVVSLHCTDIFAQVQNDSAVLLTTVDILSVKEQNTFAGNWVYQLSEDNQNFSNTKLSDLIQKLASFQLNVYGEGALSSTSLNGSASKQTYLLWNGVEVQSPMNGLADLNLINAQLFDNIQVNIGTDNSTMQQAIIMQNNIDSISQRKIDLRLNASSLQNLGYSAKIVDTHKNFGNYSLTLCNNFAKNRFKYLDYTKIPNVEKINENSDYQQFSFEIEHLKHFNKSTQLKSGFWYSYSYRHIAPALLETNYAPIQKDISYRFFSEWKRNFFKNEWTILGYWVSDDLFYDQSNFDTPSKNTFHRGEVNISSRRKLNQKLILLTELANKMDFAISNNYLEQKSRNFTSLNAMLDYSYVKQIKFSFALTPVLYQFSKILPQGQFGINYYINHNLRLGSLAGYNVTIPTMNDLYWKDFGNDKLKNERNRFWQSDIVYNIKKDKVVAEASVQLYYKNVDDWIQWSPDMTGLWRPQNLKNVVSYGIIPSFSYEYRFNNSDDKVLKFSASYHWSQAINQKVYLESEASTLNKQLMNRAADLLNFTTFIKIKKISLTLDNQFVGKRYITTDNSQFLKPFFITHLAANYEMKSLRVTVKCKNILNQKYEWLAFRPMPLRYFELNLHYRFGLK
ncbi:MAG: TonB-dependent receptor plug domain-containing protein [Saprospiraceae bacterium]|nr:TonB-dependent receptor plug domain-containing protein [Saprospiraceae bacterium]